MNLDLKQKKPAPAPTETGQDIPSEDDTPHN
nr:MAG TPA: hypothetical protein [Caudoviricetes sp.]